MEIKIHDITFFEACSVWTEHVKNPDQMNGRTEKRRKERRKERTKQKRNEDQKKWRNEGTNEGMIDGMKEWINEGTNDGGEGTPSFDQNHDLLLFQPTWLTLSTSTVGMIWHILSLGQISIEVPLFKVSLLGSLLIYAFFSLGGIMASIKFLKYLVWQSTKAKDNHIGIRKKERKKRTTSKCLEMNRDIPLDISIPKFLTLWRYQRNIFWKKELTWLGFLRGGGWWFP